MHELRIMVSIVGLLDQFGRKIDHLDQKRRYIYINELQGSTMANLLKGKDAKLRVYGSYELWQPGYRKSMLFLIAVIGCPCVGAVYFVRKNAMKSIIREGEDEHGDETGYFEAIWE
jgi:hypothetical protein